jgi:hypothetical protein
MTLSCINYSSNTLQSQNRHRPVSFTHFETRPFLQRGQRKPQRIPAQTGEKATKITSNINESTGSNRVAVGRCGLTKSAVTIPASVGTKSKPPIIAPAEIAFAHRIRN